MLIYRIITFIVGAIMCFSPLERPVITEPETKNYDTGCYFLPDYGHPLIAAHRTGKGLAPENTLMAIQSCVEDMDRDIDIFEMDLQLTKDKKLVLYHSLYLDEKSDAEEYFGKKNITVFSKTYAELRNLNMGEKFKSGGKTPYAGLRGDDIPDNLRIVLAEDAFDYIEEVGGGKYRYIVEIKYPSPWMQTMIKELYRMLSERDMLDRVIVGSYWNDVSHYIDNHYKGKLMRSANPFEIADFYGKFTRNEKLKKEKIKFMALQMPYYEDDGKFYIGNLGKTEFMEYAHKYGISVQYWTVNNADDVKALTLGGADVLMTDHPERAFKALGYTD
ncbi:MAG: hypothetical protein K6F09_06930 [Clostridiales bacterium]|nr:hypothetical protein [Clostridiales bacterium]